MEHLDSRGVRRTYGVSLEDGVLRIWREHAGFDQRFSAELGPESFEGQCQLAKTPGDWQYDLKVRYRRLAAQSLHLFAGLRVRDFQAVLPWYRRLLGEPPFFPHTTEAVWTLAENRSVYVVEQASGAGASAVTIFLADLDARVAAIAARGLEPDARDIRQRRTQDGLPRPRRQPAGVRRPAAR